MGDKKQKKKDSKLSIVAAVMALFTFTIPVALILAIVDLIKSKGNRSQRHLGSYFAIIFSILMLIVVIDRNGNNNNADGINVTKQAATTEQNTDTVTYDNTTLKYLKHDVITDSNDREVLVVYFDFANNSEDNTAFAYNYNVTCFQNGKEKIYIYFSKDFNLKSGNYKTGDKITTYGLIVNCENNGAGSYNSISFIPRFIEK